MKIAGIVTEARARVLFALLLLRDDQLLNNPVSAVADELGLDVSVAYRHIKALKAEGLLESVGRYGVRILVPRAGWLYHRHGSRLPCCCKEQRVEMTPSSVCDVVADHFQAPGPTSCCRYRIGGEMPITRAVKKIKGEIELYEKRRGRQQAPRRTAMMLLSFYTKERRKHSAAYQPTHGDQNKAGKVVRRLKSRFVGPELFGRYVAFAFELFPRIVRNKKAPGFPPVAFLTSETVIDNFVAELGHRRVNVERAAEMLKKAGHGDQDPAIVATIARNCHEQNLPVPSTIDESLRAAVTFVLEHFADVGYRPDET